MPDPLDTFDHVVVLMFENRSFDNMLGYLYDPAELGEGASFEGVVGKELSNPIPPYCELKEKSVPVQPVPKGVTESPNPDPGEEYQHANTQVFGTILPEENLFQKAGEMKAPFNLPTKLPKTAPMSGFVTDYVSNFHEVEGLLPTYDQLKVIMQCYSPTDLPVLSGLARGFAVCDHWHCDAPTQTYPNRTFFHCATSGGMTVNTPLRHWPLKNDATTLFDRLTEKGLSWKIYYSSEDLVCQTQILHYPRLKKFDEKTYFGHMEDFYRDVAEGTLPHYAFVEPRFFVNHTDQHPPAKILGHTQYSGVLGGERLMSEVYEAIRKSDNKKGSHFANTLLFITHDEHGGCYDHVSPPAAVPPDPANPVGQLDFKFDRLGVRVPAVFVSAYIEPGTIVNRPLQHTSFLRTVGKKWGLEPLTDRDRTAPEFTEVFNRTEPRPASEWPQLTPRPTPATDSSNVDNDLNHLQRTFLRMVAAHKGGAALANVDQARTVREATGFLRKHL